MLASSRPRQLRSDHSDLISRLSQSDDGGFLGAWLREPAKLKAFCYICQSGCMLMNLMTRWARPVESLNAFRQWTLWAFIRALASVHERRIL